MELLQPDPGRSCRINLAVKANCCTFVRSNTQSKILKHDKTYFL